MTALNHLAPRVRLWASSNFLTARADIKFERDFSENDTFFFLPVEQTMPLILFISAWLLPRVLQDWVFPFSFFHKKFKFTGFPMFFLRSLPTRRRLKSNAISLPDFSKVGPPGTCSFYLFRIEPSTFTIFHMCPYIYAFGA